MGEVIHKGDHESHPNERLNRLLLKVAIHLGEIKPSKINTWGFDNICIPTKKTDATFCCKKFKAYQPGVSFINDVPFHVTGIQGRTPAKFGQCSTFLRTLALLDEKDVKITRFRADAASYREDVMELMEKREIEFNIRANNTKSLFERITDLFNNWPPARLGDDFFEITSFEYKKRRHVTTRRPSTDGKLHKHTGTAHAFRSIVPTNRKMSDLDCVWFYNQRGATERRFNQLNNDWNWSRMPFSFLDQNTGFLIITAWGMVVYEHLNKTFAAKVPFVEDTFWLKAFRHHFINVASEWKGDTLLLHDSSSRQWHLLPK